MEPVVFEFNAKCDKTLASNDTNTLVLWKNYIGSTGCSVKTLTTKP